MLSYLGVLLTLSRFPFPELFNVWRWQTSYLEHVCQTNQARPHIPTTSLLSSHTQPLSTFPVRPGTSPLGTALVLCTQKLFKLSNLKLTQGTPLLPMPPTETPIKAQGHALPFFSSAFRLNPGASPQGPLRSFTPPIFRDLWVESSSFMTIISESEGLTKPD